MVDELSWHRRRHAEDSHAPPNKAMRTQTKSKRAGWESESAANVHNFLIAEPVRKINKLHRFFCQYAFQSIFYSILSLQAHLDRELLSQAMYQACSLTCLVTWLGLVGHE